MPSLKGLIDRLYTRKEGTCTWYWVSPKAQGHSYTSIRPSQCGKPVVSGAFLGVLVGGTTLSNRDVSFSSMFAGEGGLLGPPERLSGTSSS